MSRCQISFEQEDAFARVFACISCRKKSRRRTEVPNTWGLTYPYRGQFQQNGALSQQFALSKPTMAVCPPVFSLFSVQWQLTRLRSSHQSAARVWSSGRLIIHHFHIMSKCSTPSGSSVHLLFK